MTSFSGRLRPTWTNFLGTVVERPRCRWKHSKLNQIKTRKFSALSEPSKGRLAAREPWVCPGGGPNSSTGLGLVFQQTAPFRLLYPERVRTGPRSHSQFSFCSNTCGDKTSRGRGAEPVLGLRALEEGEAQLEAQRGEINSASVNPGRSDSGLPHREPSTWGVCLGCVQGDQMRLKDASPPKSLLGC